VPSVTASFRLIHVAALTMIVLATLVCNSVLHQSALDGSPTRSLTFAAPSAVAAICLQEYLTIQHRFGTLAQLFQSKGDNATALVTWYASVQPADKHRLSRRCLARSP
jgi:ferritin